MKANEFLQVVRERHDQAVKAAGGVLPGWPVEFWVVRISHLVGKLAEWALVARQISENPAAFDPKAIESFSVEFLADAITAAENLTSMVEDVTEAKAIATGAQAQAAGMAILAGGNGRGRK